MMKDKKRGISKKSQVTIFVIIAILIVVAIATLVILNKVPLTNFFTRSNDPRAYMEKCTQDAFREAEKEVIIHGGFFEGSLKKGNYIEYEGDKIVFLCYSSGKYEICTNKHPALSEEIKKEVANFVKPRVEKCFNDLKKQLGNYDYKEGELNFSVELLPYQFSFKINKKISWNRNGQDFTLEIFNTKINSPLFYFIERSIEVVNQEVDCDCRNEACNADIIGMFKQNKNFEVTKRAYLNTGEEVYVVKEVISGKEFNFAIRNCVRLL